MYFIYNVSLIFATNVDTLSGTEKPHPLFYSILTKITMISEISASISSFNHSSAGSHAYAVWVRLRWRPPGFMAVALPVTSHSQVIV